MQLKQLFYKPFKWLKLKLKLLPASFDRFKPSDEAGKIHAKNLWKKKHYKKCTYFCFKLWFHHAQHSPNSIFLSVLSYAFFCVWQNSKVKALWNIGKTSHWLSVRYTLSRNLDFSCQKGQWNFNIFYTQSYLQPHRMNQPIYSKINSGRFSYNWKNDSWKLQFTKHKH